MDRTGGLPSVMTLFPAPQLGAGFLKLEGPASLAERHPWLRWIGFIAKGLGA